MKLTMTEYEKFQQWLNDCPVKITDYQDFTDQFQITFDVELEEEVITTDETVSDSYGSKVDRLVDSMGS